MGLYLNTAPSLTISPHALIKPSSSSPLSTIYLSHMPLLLLWPALSLKYATVCRYTACLAGGGASPGQTEGAGGGAQRGEAQPA